MGKQRNLTGPFGEITVTWTSPGVRIDAPDQLAADWALGWWHAHEAGDEAVFARSFWRGTLGAGARPSAARTEVDTFIGHWSFEADLGAETARLSLNHRARLQAYADGFNEGRRRPSRELPWAPEDCHLLVRTLGFLEWWETRAPQMEFLLRAVQEGLEWDKVLDLWPGLGPEPDRSPWAGLDFPQFFSPEARVLVNAVRRFRPGSLWAVPGGRTASGRPLVGAAWVTDVTEPGLPFVPVRIQTAAGAVRGLSRPGHPGFLAGKTASLAWAASPAVDDSVDLRILDRAAGRSLAGVWAGTGRTGTLQALLTMEDCPTADQARERTKGLGSAGLDWVAADRLGGTARWSQGPRWRRTNPRDAWLPVPWGPEGSVEDRAGDEAPENGCPGVPGKLDADRLEALLARPTPLRLEELVAPVRFLLPDTEAGRLLRQWTGDPPEGPAAAAFERLSAALWDCFWETSPVKPTPGSPVVQSLLPAVERLLQAPHSAWLPSAEKNRRLAEAVRRAFAPGTAALRSRTVRRLAPRPEWTEDQGTKPRVLASTVALVCDPADPGWRLFLTDDESETPVFTRG